MRRALYDPETGYYRRRDSDPFGRAGDFYTAVQLAPVFGEMLQMYVRRREPKDVVDLGAGRGELREWLGEWNYRAVDWNLASFPDSIDGLVVANEFFDALPVRLLHRENGEWRELLVCGDRLVAADDLDPALGDYARRYGEPIPDGGLLEVNAAMGEWIDRIANVLTCGRLLIIDYGYDARELLRFPHGTLMSYHRHVASERILDRPGSRDITAHVNFTELRRLAVQAGFEVDWDSCLAAWVLGLIEPSEFEDRWKAADEGWRLRWKQLVFGMGETFRVLEFRKDAHWK